MDLSRTYLNDLAPWAPSATKELRLALDLAGLEVKNITDDQISLELLANRGDHRSYEGMVRELAAHLQPPGAAPIEALDVAYASDEGWERRHDSGPTAELTQAYELLDFDLPSGPATWSPGLADLLVVAGVDPTAHPVVQATNIVALELGQPLHAFDRDALEGRPKVRRSIEGERIHLLGEEGPRSLPAGVLVIADAVRPVAIAGVLGGVETAVTASTTSFTVESACFDPTEVRRSAQLLRLATIASQRFERGGDPAGVRRGLRRLVALVSAASGTPSGLQLTEVKRWAGEDRRISLTAAAATRMLGFPLDDHQVAEHLRWFGYRADDQASTFTVPSWRLPDVDEPADLIEDIAQAITYDALPEASPSIASGALPSESDRFKASVEAALVAAGHFEVFGDTFHDQATAGLLAGLEPSIISGGVGDYVRLINSVDPRHGLLRRSCLVTAADIVQTNVSDGIADGAAFEWARVYRAADSDWGLDERPVLWFARFSKTQSATSVFGRARGALEDLARATGLLLQVRRAAPGATSAFHAHQTAHITCGSTLVGLIGGVKPAVSEGLGLGSGSLVYVELDLKALSNERTATARPARPIRSNYRMRRHLSFSCAGRLDSDELLAAVQPVDEAGRTIQVSFDSDFNSDDGVRSILVVVDLDRREWSSKGAATEYVNELGRQAETLLDRRAVLRIG